MGFVPERIKKPPIGIMPRWLWEELCRENQLEPRASNAFRQSELIAASIRYRAAGMTPKQEWLEEWEVNFRPV